MPEPLLIEQERANELIAAMEDPVLREAARVLLEDVVHFYRIDHSRLQGSFDLAFFADVMKYDIGDMAQLVHEVVPGGYWENPGILPERPRPRLVDPDPENGSPWLRETKAYNYCVLHGDKWVGEIIFRLFNYAVLKQEVMSKTKRHYTAPPRNPVRGAAPLQPFDLLFMVMAVDNAMQPGRSARRMLEKRALPESE
jgi:hypothetical protein